MKKLLSIIVILIMIMSMLAVPAFGEEGFTTVEYGPYQICGFKIDDETGESIASWPIILEKLNDTIETPAYEYYDSVNTDFEGKYCFSGLYAGTYRVTEEQRLGWEMVEPANGSHIVTLPGENLIYGIGRVPNRTIYEINPITGLSEAIFDTSINTFNISGPNGLAYDSANDILYYVTYPADASIDPTKTIRAKMYKLENGVQTYVGDLGQEIACADFYNGKYYYIEGGNLFGGTDNMYEVTFNADGSAIDHVTSLGSISDDLYKWMFYGDIAIAADGTLYGSGKNYNNPSINGDYQFFKVQLDGNGFKLINPNLGKPLQLAFGGDGVLYGHNLDLHAYYAVNVIDGTIGNPVSYSDILPGFNDMASGIQYYNFRNRMEPETYKICGFKLNDDTGAPIEGWTIHLDKWNGEAWQENFVAPVETDANGKYCFTDLPEGKYQVREDMEDGWQQVYPADGGHIVNLPNDTMIYGIQRLTGKIFEVDPLNPMAATEFMQIDSTILNKSFSGTSPNGIAYDQETGDVYFATYPAISKLYKIEDGVQRDLGTLIGGVASGEIYNDKYYYIADGTDDLYVVSFKADGTIDTITPHLNISGGASAWYFGDIVVDHVEGVIYGEGQSGQQQFFKVNLDGSGYQLIRSFNGNLLQLAIGTDNVIYAHSAYNGEFYKIDRTTGLVETVADGDNLYTDISSASVCYYNFGNRPLYSISGTKYEDFYTGDNTRETLSGWTIYLFDRQLEDGEFPSEELSGFIASTMTDSNGDYIFDRLKAGTYFVYEMVEDCYGQYLPEDGFYQVTTGKDEPAQYTDKDFVNRRGVIEGIKFEFDSEENPTETDFSNGLEGWTILLYKDEPATDGIPDADDAYESIVTDSNGYYRFDKLCPGTYYVYELLTDGWKQTYPEGGFYEVNLAAGAIETCKHFGNTEDYEIKGYKLNYEGNTGIEGWEIILSKDVDGDWEEQSRQNTGVDGSYSFEGLKSGIYKVTETPKDGWQLMEPNLNEHQISLPGNNYDPEIEYNFVNAKLYKLCGNKYGVDYNDKETPLEGWKITLEKLDDDEWVPVDETFTGPDGKYCFEDLIAGTYRLTESYGEMNSDGYWEYEDKFYKPVKVGGESQIVELSGETASDCDANQDNDMFYNFYNACFTDETAWAFGDIALNNLENLTSDNWGWSITVTTSGAIGATFDQPIYAGAGQNDTSKGYLIGNVHIEYEPGKIPTYDIDLLEEEGIEAYVEHVWIGKTELPLDKNGNFTNAPGQLTKIIPIDYELETPIFMAIHLGVYVPCEYPNDGQ